MNSGQEGDDHYDKKTLLCKSIKGSYNQSSHRNIFVFLLPGKSAKAFQSLQNGIGQNPIRLLDLESSSLSETNRQERNF